MGPRDTEGQSHEARDGGCEGVGWGTYSLVGAGLLVVLLGDLRPAPAIAEQAGESWFEEVGERAGIKHKHTSRSFKNPYAHIMQGYTALGAAQ